MYSPGEPSFAAIYPVLPGAYPYDAIYAPTASEDSLVLVRLVEHGWYLFNKHKHRHTTGFDEICPSVKEHVRDIQLTVFLFLLCKCMYFVERLNPSIYFQQIELFTFLTM